MIMIKILVIALAVAGVLTIVSCNQRNQSDKKVRAADKIERSANRAADTISERRCRQGERKLAEGPRRHQRRC